MALPLSHSSPRDPAGGGGAVLVGSRVPREERHGRVTSLYYFRGVRRSVVRQGERLLLGARSFGLRIPFHKNRGVSSPVPRVMETGPTRHLRPFDPPTRSGQRKLKVLPLTQSSLSLPVLSVSKHRNEPRHHRNLRPAPHDPSTSSGSFPPRLPVRIVSSRDEGRTRGVQSRARIKGAQPSLAERPSLLRPRRRAAPSPLPEPAAAVSGSQGRRGDPR